MKGLAVGAENMQAAESRIRDADMAAEVVEFTKNSILLQASMAMLAQANLKPQTILQLLG
jgi:flagellin